MKKLTLALVAILLALTCVFAACGKKDNTDTPADNTDTTPAPAETVKKDDLTKIAEQFKADYVANFLDLYTSETVAVIESEKSATLIKIQAATTAAEAQKAADDFFTFLKGQKTIIDAAKDLLTKIADVALADEGAINQLKIYKDQITAAQASATSTAKKAALEAYDAATQKSVDETIARLADLKDAKREADKKDAINDEIKDLKKDFDAVVKFTLSEVNQYTDLMKKVNAFAAKYDIVVGSDAYKEIFDVASIAAAEAVMNKAYADSDALGLMQKVLEQRDAVAKAAEDARWKGQVLYVDAKKLVSVDVDANNDGTPDYGTFTAPVALTPATATLAAFNAGYDTVVVLDGAFKYAKSADLYATEAAAKTAKQANITEVENRGKTTGTPAAPSATAVAAPTDVDTDYKLAVQDAVKAAKEAVTNLFKKYNETELKNQFNYGATGDVLKAAVTEINDIVAAYDISVVRAQTEYSTAANTLFTVADKYTTGGKSAALGEMATDAIYTLGVTLKSKAADNQKIISDKIAEVLPTFRGLDVDGNETYDAQTYADGTNGGNYGEYKAGAYYYTLNDKDQPAIAYTAWTYRYQLNGKDLALNDFSAIDELATNAAITSDLAAGTIEWLEKYIGDGDYEASYNLYLFKKSDDSDVFGKKDILYMTDRDLTEVADARVNKINGKAVEVAKTDAVAAKVLSVYNVAKALVAEQEKIDAAQAEAMEKLQAAALALREAGDANAVAALRTAFTAVANGEAISDALYGDVYYAPYTKLTSDSSNMATKLAALKVTVQEETLNAAKVEKAIDDGATGILRDAEAIRDAAKTLAIYVDSTYVAVKTASGALKANADAQADNADYLKFYDDKIVASALKKLEVATKGDSLKLIGDESVATGTYQATDAAGNLTKKAATALLENVYTLRKLFANEKDTTGGASDFETAYDLAYNKDTKLYDFLAGKYDGSAFANIAAPAYKTFLNRLSTKKGVTDYADTKYFDGTPYPTVDGLDKYLAGLDAAAGKDLKELKAEVETLEDNLEAALKAYKGISAVKAATIFAADKATLATLATAVTNFAKTYKCDYVNIKISETIVDGTVYDFDLLTEAYREQILVKAYAPIDKVLTYSKDTTVFTNATVAYNAIKAVPGTSTWQSASEGKVEFRGAAVPTVTSIKTGDALVSDYEVFESDYNFEDAANQMNTADPATPAKTSAEAIKTAIGW